jgi:hypothetical protein
LVAEEMKQPHSIPPPDVREGADMGYMSHLPVLARALLLTGGSVLELGAGWGSTPLLHAACEASGRYLYTRENDGNWLAKFSSLASKRHLFINDIPDEYFGFVFVDSSPGEERNNWALRFRDKTDFIIMHDHEAGSGAAYYYEQIIPEFKHAEVYRFLKPHTLILSNVRPFGLSDFEQGR